jgi:hypothetical protein
MLLNNFSYICSSNSESTYHVHQRGTGRTAGSKTKKPPNLQRYTQTATGESERMIFRRY